MEGQGFKFVKEEQEAFDGNSTGTSKISGVDVSDSIVNSVLLSLIFGGFVVEEEEEEEKGGSVVLSSLSVTQSLSEE